MEEKDYSLPNLDEQALKRWVVQDEPLPEEIEEVWDIPIGNYLRPEVEYAEESREPSIGKTVENLWILMYLWLIGLTVSVGILFYLVLTGE